MNKNQVFSDHKWLQLDPNTVGIYNAWDIRATALVAKGVRQELIDNRQYEYFETYVWPFIEPVLAMQRHGLLLDSPAKTATRREIRRELKEVDEYIIQYSPDKSRNDKGHYAVLESPTRLGEFLFSILGLKCFKTTESGKPSTDLDSLNRTLQRLRKKDQQYQQVLEYLFHRSKLKTIDERYLDVQPEADGRVRPTVKFTGTETGRLAYSNPPEQQRPRSVRHIYHAAPGSVYIGADYRQLEVRIMAYLSMDTSSISVFDTGEDIHIANAMDLFDFSQDTWSGMDPRERGAARDYAKTDLYRRIYGGSWRSGKEKLFCPCHRCQGLRGPLRQSAAEMRQADARWNMKHVPVIRWRKKLVKETMDTGWYTNPYGRRRCFMAPYREIQRELYNAPMQSTAAEIMNESQSILYHQYGLTCCMQMHDFLMLEVPKEKYKEYWNTLVSVMERPIDKMGGISFPVEVKMGPNWRDLHTI